MQFLPLEKHKHKSFCRNFVSLSWGDREEKGIKFTPSCLYPLHSSNSCHIWGAQLGDYYQSQVVSVLHCTVPSSDKGSKQWLLTSCTNSIISQKVPYILPFIFTQLCPIHFPDKRLLFLFPLTCQALILLKIAYKDPTL